MKVLVTGAAGFIGSNLADALLRRGDSGSYPAGGSRNRGVLYSQVLDEVRTGSGEIPAVPDFLLPHIL